MNKQEILAKAKPIHFNTEMVRAILEERKSVTRRLIKTDLPEFLGFGYDWVSDDKAVFGFSKYGHLEAFKPKYKVGDILYVRETWGDYTYEKEHEIYYVYYRADYEDGAKAYIHPTKDEFGEDIICDLPKWHPSIHMPKEATRIFLKVKNVRVERLQDITDDQAIKEGVENEGTFYKDYSGSNNYCTPRGSFRGLWNSTINKKELDKYGWEANPYVWVIEFERIELLKE